MRYGTDYGPFQIDDLPGCTQVAVSHGSFVFPALRGKGFGHLKHDKHLTKIRELGYDLTLCTVDLCNPGQTKILEKAGWTKVYQFQSRKTGHDVGIFVRNVT